MKNTFKLMGIALLAGAMLFAGCKKDPENDPVNPDVKKYTITVNCNDDSIGTVTGGGTYEEGKNIQITATANEGYKFVKWQDGVTEAARTILVSKDETYTATFEADDPVEETTNVVFGTQKWDAGYVNAQMAQNGMIIAATKAADHQSFPMIKMYYTLESGNLANGTYNSGLILDYDEQSGMVTFEFGNPYLWYFENTSIEFQSGTQAGDWMSRGLGLTISALDLDNMKASIVANATMSRITDLFEGEYMTSVDLDDCQSRDITVTFNNLQFQAASKAMPATKAIAKMK